MRLAAQAGHIGHKHEFLFSLNCPFHFSFLESRDYQAASHRNGLGVSQQRRVGQSGPSRWIVRAQITYQPSTYSATFRQRRPTEMCVPSFPGRIAPRDPMISRQRSATMHVSSDGCHNLVGRRSSMAAPHVIDFGRLFDGDHFLAWSALADPTSIGPPSP